MLDKLNNYMEETKPLFRLLRTEAFRFIIVRYNHYSLVNKLKEDLLHHFPDRPQNSVDARNTEYRSLVDSYYNAARGFFFIENFDEILANPEIYSGLNQRRDKLALYPIALIVFISSSTEELFARQIMEKMPDLWSFRSLLLDLEVEASQMVQIENWNQSVVSEQVNTTTKTTTLGGRTSEEKEQELDRLLTRIKSIPNTESDFLRIVYEQIANLYEDLYRHENAIEYFLKLGEIQIKNGDKTGLGTTYNNIGFIYSQKRNFDKSLEYYIKSKDIRLELNDNATLGTINNNIGGVYSEIGNYEEALKFYKNAETIFLESGNKDGLGATYNNISGYYVNKSDWNKAREFLLRSERLRMENGDRKGLGATYFNLGFVYSKLGDMSNALEFYLKSEKLHEEFEDIEKLKILYLRIAEIYIGIEARSKAIDYYRKLAEIEQKAGNKIGIGNALNYMAIVTSDMGDFNKSLVLHHEAEKIRYEIGDDSGLIQTLYNIGMEWLKIKDGEKALDYFNLAGYIAKKKGMDFELKQMDWAMRELIKKHGQKGFMKIGKKLYESWQEHAEAERKK